MFYHGVQTFVDFGLIEGITRVSSGRYSLRTETWDTGWILLSPEGSRSLEATESILMRISKSSMFLGIRVLECNTPSFTLLATLMADVSVTN